MDHRLLIQLTMVLLPAINSNPPACPSGCGSSFVRRGFFHHKDGSRHQRFRCSDCRRSFCESFGTDAYREKRGELRREIFLHYSSGTSQRRLAKILNAHRTTIVRKFLILANAARKLLIEDHHKLPLVTELQFDDMESFEHTKCKPLSMTIAVETGTRRIIGLRVSRMPAKGVLAAISREKYGPREDKRPEARAELFKEIKPFIAPGCKFVSDMNPHYPPDVAEHFPGHPHETHKGRRGCVVGQGELKRGGHDPLFSLNHTCAMFRANVNRLFRRTWNTTKRPDRLEAHMMIYALFHNRYVIHHPSV